MRTVEEIRAELPRVAFAADRYVATRKSEQQYEIELRAAITTNIPIDRLKAICAAEKDGRLVTLPCKVGDTVYVITQVFNGNKIERAIGSRKIDRIGGNALNPVWVVSPQPYELHFFPSEFGKTVFLTRDEAEKTLGKEQG